MENEIDGRWNWWGLANEDAEEEIEDGPNDE